MTDMTPRNMPSAVARVTGLPGHDGEGEGNQPLTLEQVTAIVNNTVNTTVNNAIANLKKSDLPRIIGTSMEAGLKPLSDQLASITDTLGKFGGGQGAQGGHGGGQGAQGGQGGQGSGQAGGQQSGSIPPEINVQLRELLKSKTELETKLNQIEEQRLAAEKKVEVSERESIARAALTGLQFQNEHAAQTAFSLVMPHVQRDDSGNIIADGNLTVDAFVKEFLNRDHAYLLKPQGSSGAGASGSGSQSRGTGAGTTEMIRPGMKPEERQAVVNSISQVLGQMRRG